MIGVEVPVHGGFFFYAHRRKSGNPMVASCIRKYFINEKEND